MKFSSLVSSARKYKILIECKETYVQKAILLIEIDGAIGCNSTGLQWVSTLRHIMKANVIKL